MANDQPLSNLRGLKKTTKPPRSPKVRTPMDDWRDGGHAADYLRKRKKESERAQR